MESKTNTFNNVQSLDCGYKDKQIYKEEMLCLSEINGIPDIPDKKEGKPEEKFIAAQVLMK